MYKPLIPKIPNTIKSQRTYNIIICVVKFVSMKNIFLMAPNRNKYLNNVYNNTT